MKKIALTTIMVFISYIALSQPRVDGKVTAKILRSSSIISDIVGWEYDMTTKKWCGYYNTLRNIYSQNNEIPKRISPSKMSACDNIISIQIKTVLFNGRKYYLLIIPYYSGDWRYPEILRDWYFGKVNNVYILKEEEYEKMKKLDDGINHIKVIKGKSYGHPSFSWFETFNQAFISLFDDDKGEIDDDQRNPLRLGRGPRRPGTADGEGSAHPPGGGCDCRTRQGIGGEDCTQYCEGLRGG